MRRFSSDQVGRAKEAIRATGLPTASDLKVGGIHDTASLTYAWRLDGQSGSVTNWVYPARAHPVFDLLEEQLDLLEVEAGAEQSSE